MTFSVNVHEVKLGAGAIVVYRMVSRGVDVPANEVDSLIVIGQRGVVSIDSLGVLHRKSRAISPVPEVSDRLVGIIESGDVVQRKTVVETERNWRLLGSRLAEFVL